jgi:hypothetical protein
VYKSDGGKVINSIQETEYYSPGNHHHHHHHHKHQGLDPLIRSVSRATTALAKFSSVFQLFFFLVVCSDMISKGFGLVAFFASVKASSVCIHLGISSNVMKDSWENLKIDECMVLRWVP